MARGMWMPDVINSQRSPCLGAIESLEKTAF